MTKKQRREHKIGNQRRKKAMLLARMLSPEAKAYHHNFIQNGKHTL
jgi:hypothetical protein